MNKQLLSICLFGAGLFFLPPVGLGEPVIPKSMTPPTLPPKVSTTSTWVRIAYALPGSNALESEDWSAIFNTAPRRNGRESQPPLPGAPPEEPIPVPLKSSVTHQGSVNREVIEWSNSKKTEKWIYNGFVLEESVLDGKIAVTDPRFSAEYAKLFGSSPYTELFWLRPAFYRGTRQIQGKLFHYYRADPAAGPNSKAGDEFITASMSAWIDAETGLPFASTDDDSLWIYRHGQPDVNLLALPTNFQAALKESEERFQRLIGRYKAVKP